MIMTIFHIGVVIWMLALSTIFFYHVVRDQERIESVISRIERQDIRLGEVLERIDDTLNKILELARESRKVEM